MYRTLRPNIAIGGHGENWVNFSNAVFFSYTETKPIISYITQVARMYVTNNYIETNHRLPIFYNQ